MKRVLSGGKLESPNRSAPREPDVKARINTNASHCKSVVKQDSYEG